MRFPGKNLLFVLVFALQIVPIQVCLIPLLKLYNKPPFNLMPIHGGQNPPAGGLYSVWLSHTIFALPLAIFLLHNFMREIPGELIESARVDGAGHVQIFSRIMLPLMTPAIAAFGVLQFLWVWNDLLVAMIFSQSTPPLTKALTDLTGTRGQDWPLLTAGAFVSMVIPMIVFIALQRFFVRGLLAGSVKAERREVEMRAARHPRVDGGPFPCARPLERREHAQRLGAANATDQMSSALAAITPE